MSRLFFAAIAVWLCTVAAAVADTKRPNIVLIMGDDIGYSDYGCFGGEIATPNIDRLAAEGLKFTQFYNNAVCVPTRYSLLTGRYPRYIGKDHHIGLTPEVSTVAEILAAAGYRASLSGKWHLGSVSPNRPTDHGFEEYYGLATGCCNYFNPAKQDPPFEGGRFRTWLHNNERITAFPPGFYTTDAITDHACRQIRRFSDAGDPFFVHVCFTAAHSPLHAKPADIAKYQGRYDGGWDALRAARRKRQLELKLIDPNWAVSPREPEFLAWQDEPLKEWNANLMTVYAAMVDSLDQGVGRILQTLADTGHDRDTIVMILNDNGGCAEQAGGDDPTNIAGPAEHYVSCGAGWAWAQNTPLRRYKSWIHEGGISTPLIVRWPATVKPGTTTNQVGHVIDVLPTIVEATNAQLLKTREGLAAPPPEGTSLLPILRGESRQEPAALYWANLDNRGIRIGNLKLVWDENVRRWELYDITADRSEMHDLAEQEPERVKAMAADWQAWAESTGAVHRLGMRSHLKNP
jgi:arylsulfatase